jgi:hypothetical protein
MMKKITRFTVIAVLAAGMLIVGGCPKVEEDPPIDPALAGSWSNEDQNDLRTFIINDDGSFSASLAPYGIRGQVTGKLNRAGDDYIMSDMDETTGQSWGDAVSLYNGQYVVITFSNKNNTFTLTSENSMVQAFFGGAYHRQP